MKSAALTDIGRKRAINQDYIYRSDEEVGRLPSLYIVADGMGGHKAGDYASRFCVEEFLKKAKEGRYKSLLGGLGSIIGSVNERVYEEAKKDISLNGMGTTLVAAVVGDDTVTVANVGDSRLYILFSDEGLKQITVDHSLVESLIRHGDLDRKEAAHHPKKNVITRAIGVEAYVEPDFFEVEVKKEDIILLCSDGLTNMVDDERICACLRNKGLTLEEKVKELVRQANEAGGKDNISVVLIEI